MAAQPSQPREFATPLTLQESLEQYPWVQAPEGVPLEWLWHFDTQIPVEQLWPWVCDTSTFNRAVTLPRMHYQELDGVLHGRTRYNGLRHDWVEPPWSWIAERYILCTRHFHRGPAKCLQIMGIFESHDWGTRLYLRTAWYPKNRLLRPGYRVAFPLWKRRYARAIQKLERNLLASPQSPPWALSFPASRAKKVALHLDRFRLRLLEHGCSKSSIDALFQHIQTQEEIDVSRIRPYAIARAHNISDEDMLITCLHATIAGIITMSWDVICPHCRGVRERLDTLGDVPQHSRCEPCLADFDTADVNAIEITFQPHPSIRAVEHRTYCAAEPAHKAHIHVQMVLPPKTEQTVLTSLPQGNYRLRLLGEKRSHEVQSVASFGNDQKLRWCAETGPSTLEFSPRPQLHLINETDETQHFIIEASRWVHDAVRPAMLFTLQAFRDLFVDQHLAAGMQLELGEQTLLFTDVVGSSRLYEEHGNGVAFTQVKRHFVEVFEDVRTHHGAVVKTMGDAAMAAFHSPVDALKTAFSLQQRFHEHREDSFIRLRISINVGPCVAVNLNTGIDYFGTTVNVAAKLQSCVEEGQIVFPRALQEDPDCLEFLEENQAPLESLTFSSAKLKNDVDTLRWSTFSRPFLVKTSLA